MKIKRPEPQQTIPKDVKKAFQGIIYDSYQWQQKQFDGSFATFEMLKRPDTTGVIPITADKKIVLTEQRFPGREKAFVGLPGGRIDEGEDVEDAARRELLEETGFEVQRLDLWFATQPMEKIDWVIYTFIAKDCRQVTELNLDAGEKIELKIVNFDEFVDIVLDESFRDKEEQFRIAKAKIDGKLDEIRDLFFT